MDGGEREYIFGRELEAERRRLELQSAAWDPRTFRLLSETGIREGWRCLEVGAGAGSVARWLADRVGDAGRVTATDVDTRLLEPLRSRRLEVRRHDIVSDPLEDAAYDLVHARLLLAHLARPAAVVRRLAGAVRPGGWVVLEEFDLRTSPLSHPADDAYARAANAMAQALEAAGGGTARGLELPGAMEAAGLVDVSAHGTASVVRSGSKGARVASFAFRQLRRAVVSSGLLTDEDLDAAIDRLEDGAAPLWLYSPLMVSAQGRRPGPA